MFFASDNSGPAHPQVMAALHAVNEGYRMPYGADAEMDEVRRLIREIFEAPEAAVYLVATGTAANSIALATLADPWSTIFCTPMSHINEDECNAPEFYTGGAKLTLVEAPDAKMDPTALRAAIAAEETRGVHGPQRGPLALTTVTEKGTVYTVAELMELSAVAREFGLPVHLDGARFANALVALGCTPAEMTWKAGIDAVSFGATKNGCPGVEAVIFFDPAKAWEFELRRKRGGHLFSKHRYLSAQMLGYLTDDLWLSSARTANAACARLADGLQARGATLLYPRSANIIFAEWARSAHQSLHDAGAAYYLWKGDLAGDNPNEPLQARLVTNWATTEADVDGFLSVMGG